MPLEDSHSIQLLGLRDSIDTHPQAHEEEPDGQQMISNNEENFNNGAAML